MSRYRSHHTVEMDTGKDWSEEMKLIPYDSEYKPGTWKGGFAWNGKTALVTCINGHTCTLSEHKIADDGTVSPSLVCPYDGCNFHEFVKLEGWVR